MTKELAIKEFPRWAMDEYAPAEQTRNIRRDAEDMIHDFKRKHGILLALVFVWGFSMIVGCCLTGMIVRANTAAQVRAEAAAEYDARLEQYKAEQAYQAQAEHFLSGDASREAFINQEIDAAAHFIAEEANETMKGTKLGVAIARLMAGGYGSTLREVINQPDQWMFYSGEDNKFTQADREFAEGIVRRYYEDNIIPNDLTTDIQWIVWSPGDYQAMNNWNASAATRKWRYHG